MWRTEDCRELTASSINHNTNIQLFFETIKFWSNFFQKNVIFCRKEEIRTPVLTVRDRNSVTQHFPFIYHRSGALRSRPLNYFSICWTKRNRTADTAEFFGALYHWVIVLRAKLFDVHLYTFYHYRLLCLVAAPGVQPGIKRLWASYDL